MVSQPRRTQCDQSMTVETQTVNFSVRTLFSRVPLLINLKVCKVTGSMTEESEFNSRQGNGFFLLSIQIESVARPILDAISPGFMRPGCEDDRLRPGHTKFKNGYMALCLITDNLPFFS
jgi:hypothetical protein